MERIPLEHRFKMAELQNPDFLEIFDMRLTDYLTALNSLVGKNAACNISDEVYDCVSHDKGYKMGALVAATIGLFEDEHECLNYAVLVRPFSMMRDKEQEKTL